MSNGTPRASLPSIQYMSPKTPQTPNNTLNRQRKSIFRKNDTSMEPNISQSVLDFSDTNKIKSQINWYKENYNKKNSIGKPVFYADSFYNLSAQCLNGKFLNFSILSDYVCLVVNVATTDTHTTDEFKQLNELVEKYGSKGFAVLAFLCNQFCNTQPFDQYEVMASLRFVRPGARFEPLFPIFTNTNVNGSFTSPIYEYLKYKQPFPLDDFTTLSNANENNKLFFQPISWSPIQRTDISGNFEKFLIDRNGQVVSRFSRRKQTLTNEIENLLAKKFKERAPNLSIELAHQFNS